MTDEIEHSKRSLQSSSEAMKQIDDAIEYINHKFKDVFEQKITILTALNYLKESVEGEQLDENGLKPCPFCGAHDVFVERMELEASAVFCNNCMSYGITCNTEDEEEAKLIDKNDDLWGGYYSAIKAWNTRPTTKTLEEWMKR